MKKKHSNWGGAGRGQGRKPSVAKSLLRDWGRYGVTAARIEAAGGKWDDDLSAYVFADGSCGKFSDMSRGCEERDGSGESVFHFQVVRIGAYAR